MKAQKILIEVSAWLFAMAFIIGIGYACFGQKVDTTVNKHAFDSIYKASAQYKHLYDSITAQPLLKPEPEVQKEINEGVVSAMEELAGYIDYLFILIFIVTAFTINLFITADGLCDKINFMRKWKSGWIFIWGVVLMALYIYLFDVKGKLEYFGIVFSLFLSMALYKVVGLDKLMNWLLNKLGLKLPEQTKQ